MERANAAVVPRIAGQHETVIMQSSPNISVPDTPICNGILHWGEMLFCDWEPPLFRLYGGSKRLLVRVVPPQVSRSFGEIVHFANLKRKFYDGRRAFAVVIDRQLEAHRMREKWGPSQPWSTTGDVGTLRFAGHFLAADHGEPADNKERECEESNRGVGRFRVTHKFTPPAFLLPLTA